MKRVRTAVLAGAAALLAAGAAIAASNDTHHLNVAMPDGSIARIAYQGDVAPIVTVAPAQPLALPAGLFDPFDAAPLTMLDRVAAQMERQVNAMMQEAAALDAQALPAELDLAALPASSVVHYSFVSTNGDGATCRRSVSLTALDPEQAPKLVSSSSGDCTDRPNHVSAPTLVNVKAAGEAQPPAPAATT
jgi:hypothetical protein